MVIEMSFLCHCFRGNASQTSLVLLSKWNGWCCDRAAAKDKSQICSELLCVAIPSYCTFGIYETSVRVEIRDMSMNDTAPGALEMCAL